MSGLKDGGKFTLPDETITIKFIPRRTGIATNVGEDHVISGGLLDRAIRKFYAPLQRNGSIANLLSDEEKVELERLTGLNLSVYGDFWKTFFVSLRKDDNSNKLYLGNPMDYLQYALLRAYDNIIASSWSERNNRLEYQFAIVRDGELIQEKQDKFNVKKEAMKQYIRIEDNKDRLISILKLLTNKSISEDSSLTWIQSQVEEYVDNKPKAFLNVITDAKFHTKALINKAIDLGIIVRENNKYSTIDGLTLSEDGRIPSFDNAVEYLDNVKNQDVRSLIEAKMNKDKK